MIAAAAALLLQAAAPAANAPSAAEAFRFGVERICLPAAKGVDAMSTATQLKLRPMPDRLLPGRTSSKDRAWFLDAPAPMLVIDWDDGSCSVQYLRGDPTPVVIEMSKMLRDSPDRFREGASDLPTPDLRRSIFCDPTRPFPLIVTLTSATPSAKNRMAVSSTIMRSKTPGEPSVCVRGVGIG